MTDYLPLVRQTADLRMEEIVSKETTWEEVFRESVVLLLHSLADALECTPEYLPPEPNFKIAFEFEQQHWSGRLVAKIELEASK
jgi:hypothetical protein